MEVHFTPEQRARLEQVAIKAGIEPALFVKDAALRMLDEQIDAHKSAPELPIWQLGAIGSLHRRDIYNDGR